MAKANAERALADLYALRQIGAYKTGVHRPTLSPEDMLSREWLCEKLRAFGHDAQIDGIANVFGRAPGAGPHVLAGSHIESQNHAGWLDGALGVVYALEAARAVAGNILELEPAFSLSSYGAQHPYRDPDKLQAVLSHLRAAGLPD